MTLDNLINKATDPTLTSDNWQYILDVCDKISSDPELETKVAISSLKSKLSTRDANVILRSLSLLVAIAENCGSRMKQEIASKSFLQDSLIKKLSDKKLHITVKHKIVEVLQQLYKSFQNDPSLKPMTDAYNKAKQEYPQYFKHVQGPSKPAKQEKTQQDKNKEDDELQRVLKLSLQEYERERNIKKDYLNKPLPETREDVLDKKEEEEEEQTVATVSKVRALYDLISYEEDELSFRKGDVITVIESVYRDWWRGSLPNGKIGIFPLNYVTPIVNKSPQELAKELDQEDQILNVEQRKVDRLLHLLNQNNPDEDEITHLYNEIVPLRMKIGYHIDKYNVRKEELGVLNNQITNEIKSYNGLLDQSIANRTKQQSYQTPYPQPPYPKQYYLPHPNHESQNRNSRY